MNTKDRKKENKNHNTHKHTHAFTWKNSTWYITLE